VLQIGKKYLRSGKERRGKRCLNREQGRKRNQAEILHRLNGTRNTPHEEDKCLARGYAQGEKTQYKKREGIAPGARGPRDEGTEAQRTVKQTAPRKEGSMRAKGRAGHRERKNRRRKRDKQEDRRPLPYMLKRGEKKAFVCIKGREKGTQVIGTGGSRGEGADGVGERHVRKKGQRRGKGLKSPRVWAESFGKKRGTRGGNYL